ncbi:MAG: hypothetical protein ACTH7Q_06295 [Pseudoalteromonas sp.]
MQHTDDKTSDEQAQSSAEQSAEHSAQLWQEHLAKLSGYSQQIYHDYKTQSGLCKNIAQAEWRLSTRSLALLIILLVCFAGGLVLLWAGLLATLGFAVFAFSGSVWLSAALLICLQLIFLVWTWKNIGYISNKIGFTKTLHSLKQLLNIK